MKELNNEKMKEYKKDLNEEQIFTGRSGRNKRDRDHLYNLHEERNKKLEAKIHEKE